jgi:hypothetical protein
VNDIPPEDWQPEPSQETPPEPVGETPQPELAQALRPELAQALQPEFVEAPPVVIPPREPFWGYHELLIFLGAAPIALLLGAFSVKAVFALFHFKPASEAFEILPEQLLGYVLMFAALGAVFRMWYDRPFWQSLGWLPLRLPSAVIMVVGMATAILVALGGGLVHMTNEPNPLTDLMKGRAALISMAIFGVTVAPVGEELIFRGFLQPLLVRSLGVAFGILLTSIPFGLLHFEEYGNSWIHVALLTMAGAAFGVMRHLTGSTKASALMHASYNALFFVAAFAAGKDFGN